MASSSCNKSFCSNYMLLKPEECGVLDLVRILFSSKNIGQKEFVDCPDEQMTKVHFPHRWIIFISILAQKVFLATAEPLARFGNGIEYWLNLQNVNGGFFRLLFNFLRGKVAVVPDKESAAFLSFIGNLDKRVELDIKSVEVGSRRYDEAISMMAAKAAYENKASVKDYWKMDLVDSFDFWNGKVEMPDKESASYLSAIGFIDARVNCHMKFKPGDKTYIVALSAVASKVAYENKAFIRATVEDQWKMELLGVHDFWNEYHQTKSTQGFIFHDNTSNPDRIIVSFRGTEPFNSDDWSTDFDISWYKFQGMGKVHSGFMKALGLQKDESWPSNITQDDQRPTAYYTIREKLRDFFKKNDQTKFIVTGHSLGGALAVLFAAVLAFHNESSILERLEAIYTFGQPRVGDTEFGEFMKENIRNYGIGYYRFVYSHDIVARLPYDNSTMLFKHFGTCLYYSSTYEGNIVSEEPDRNYFSLRSLISKRVDALWELVRSFLLPYLYGTEYRESLLLLALRLYGLLFPGMPAHGPQEYISAICLGDATLFTNAHR